MEKKFVTFLETRGYNASGESARVNVNVSGKFNRSKALGIGRDLHREILTRACENARTLSYCEKQWNARGEAAIPDIANKLKKVASGVWTTIVKLLTSLVERVKEFIKGFTDIETKWKNLPKVITKVENQPAREVSAEAKDKKMSITVIKGTTPDDLVKTISGTIDGVLVASGPLQKITSAETISAALDSSAPNWKADNYSEGDFKQHLQSKEFVKAIACVS